MSQTDCRLFIGAELAPTLGEWIDLNNYSDEEEFLDAVGALQDRIKAAGHEESSVMDTDGFGGLMRPDSSHYERAWLIHEILEELDDTEGEAIRAWIEHRGVEYTLFANKKLRRSDEIIDDFRGDYLGTFESEEKYAEERFTEHWDALGLEKYAESLQAYVFNHMNWERLAYDYSCDDVYYGNRDTHGVPVFARS